MTKDGFSLQWATFYSHQFVFSPLPLFVPMTPSLLLPQTHTDWRTLNKVYFINVYWSWFLQLSFDRFDRFKAAPLVFCIYVGTGLLF